MLTEQQRAALLRDTNLERNVRRPLRQEHCRGLLAGTREIQTRFQWRWRNPIRNGTMERSVIEPDSAGWTMA